MNCQEVMELMQRHVDKDLNEQETSLMMDHVGQCPECAAMLDKLVRLSRGLEQMPRVEPPYNLVDAILPQLPHWGGGEGTQAQSAESEPEQEPFAPNGRRANRLRRTWAARISGVIALGVVVAIFAINGPNFGGMGSSQQHEASLSSGAANANESSAYQLKSDVLNDNDLKVKDQYGSQMPMADVQSKASERFAPDQAPAAAPSSAPVAGSQLDNQADSAVRSSEGAGKAPAGLGAADSMNGMMAVNPTEEAANPPKSMMEIKPEVEEAISPDGKWKAVLTDGTLQLYRRDDDKPAFESAPGSGARSGLVWQEDSTGLDYTYTDAEGKTSQRSLLVPEMKEIMR